MRVDNLIRAGRRADARRYAFLAATAVAVLVPAAVVAQNAKTVVYGAPVEISGRVPSQQAGEEVQVEARRYGEATFTTVTTLTTGEGGRWNYAARPAIQTVYRSTWRDVPSASILVNVEPRVTVRARRASVYVRVVAARSFAGKFLILQRRRAGGRFYPIRRVRLGERSAARLRLDVPRGRSEIRFYMPRSQAGPGYIRTFSDVVVYTRQ